MLFGAFSLCLFFYGLLFTAESFCQKEHIMLALTTLGVGIGCMFLMIWISEEYEL